MDNTRKRSSYLSCKVSAALLESSSVCGADDLVLLCVHVS